VFVDKQHFAGEMPDRPLDAVSSRGCEQSSRIVGDASVVMRLELRASGGLRRRAGMRVAAG
jgi:hypothetical protein